MQDIKRNNRRKTTNKNQTPVVSASNFVDSCEESSVSCEVTRGNKSKSSPCNNDCGCNKPQKHDCDCHCDCTCNCNNNSHEYDCEPCEIESKTCLDNLCGPDCWNPVVPERVCVSNAIPYAIEANRVYDTMRFQTFTDATEVNGSPLYFETEVVEVNGNIPYGTQVGVTIDKVCINYSEVRIDPGCVSLEDYLVEPLDDNEFGLNCKTDFEYAVCGERNLDCCSQGKGKSVSYKQRGTVVEVEDLVLELRGRCGCTEFSALAYPIIKKSDGKRCKAEYVKFVFNTLSAPIGLPANGKSVTLRQSYETSLTVDCIGKSLLCSECCEGERYYKLEIPNGIDLILCLQETVSVLIPEQMVVLGYPNTVQPRIVDTFAKVCDFSDCSAAENGNGCNNCNKSHGSCGCRD